ncbi:nucleoside deaminase [Pseudalkalibacillus sp. SCS-8]|uniref:nucleoside deaminase n=1 Tax=Pseudalkalibacillus nanhaiensis TaxID=3115291 RepID=UPI0032DB4E83
MGLLEQDRYYLQIALEEGEIAEQESGTPFGSVLVKEDGTLYRRDRNRVYLKFDPTAHAELEVIRNSSKDLLKEGAGRHFTLYTTVEPCVMCTGAIFHSNIARVVWALDDDNVGGFRLMYSNPETKHRFNAIQWSSMPFGDLAVIQRDRMLRWCAQNNLTMSWPEIDKRRKRTLRVDEECFLV